ncbi:Peptidase family M23 [Gracilimonas mengyeensis]|uniref:Peptidase family M23 n=2 Tax=Gracilimonas mengyeensis TaxID=1302730 RepID=A0A521CWK5_9BACT|nr:Peptidase family M23 [Gracilimonas mengyeensis]
MVALMGFYSLATGQHFRASAGYNIKSVSLSYVPDKNYSGSIDRVVKSTVEAEFERYLFYRFYLAGKGEYLLQNQEDALFGGPVNFQEAYASGLLGLQWPKWGVYGGVKIGRIWDVKIHGTTRDGGEFWTQPVEPVDSYTTALTAGVKYYLLNFVRLQAEITQLENPPTEIIPKSSFTRNPAFRSFDFNPVSFTVGISISVPWTSRAKARAEVKEMKLPPLMRVSGVSFGQPLKRDTYVTSPFGKRWNRPHQGIDLKAGLRDDVVAAESGVVVKAGEGRGYGKMVRIKHARGYETVYAHMMRIKVKEGERVRKGQVVGRAGNTGTSTGVHLHFEIIKDGVHVNPLSYVRFNQ